MTEKYYSSCAQCPRKCGVNRTEKDRGFCGETDEVRIAAACLHFGEEPLITVHGGSGTIFFTGCTLRCAFCQNYQISQGGTGKSVSMEEFCKICLKLQDAGAENINLVTGSHSIPKLAEYIAAAQDAGCGLPFCWNSSAFENVEMLELLKPFVKVWLPDFKTMDRELSAKLFGAAEYPETAEKAVLWMLENFPLKTTESRAKNDYTDANGEKIRKGQAKEKIVQGVIIRHLFMPGKFQETADVLEWLKNHADGKAIISLMNQYTPVPFAEDENKLKKWKNALGAIENRLVNSQEDKDLQDLIEAFGFETLFYQELTDDTSWLPDFNRIQPFSSKLAKPLWHWTCGFIE